MNKDTKIYLSLVVIIAVIILGIFAMKNNNETPEEKLAKCIGENAMAYIQIGCSACKYQESLFGDNYKYIKTIDCKVEIQKCIDTEITGTPTWIINGVRYPGAQSIEKLKELTGC